MLLSAVLSGLLAGAGLIIAIGAQNAFVLRQGLQRRHVGGVVLTCMAGDIALILAGVGGMGALVVQWPLLLQVLRFGGAAFLLAYALLAARRAWQGGHALATGEGAAGDGRAVLLACLAFTFLNPHVYLDTMVLLGSLSTRYPPPLQWAFAAGACLSSVLWFVSLGYGARLLQPVFQRPLAWRVLDAAVALFMLVLALLLVLRPLG
ncbi:LysE family transporter [Stenotrophomonas sp. 24(2023)]|uniref:LysE/ArgO family amino acid transporter n=1 Tax=Stenotrophomonas sp. 24(2023) TaxID=3068324 RepID=UPI0027E17FEA|nr:LysE family transporter [Stenotrophomonas sp. 24(2023)]WMJ68405.1 LysE family transporter [Stenotrophomonas sp. 24(2023)]